MASHTQPSAIKIALVGWRDALRAITQMMPVAGLAFLFTLMSQAAYQLSRGHSFATDLAIFPLLWIAQGLVLTPLAIAVHRHVLLDEVAPHYALNLADQRFQRLFGVAVAPGADELVLRGLTMSVVQSSRSPASGIIGRSKVHVRSQRARRYALDRLASASWLKVHSIHYWGDIDTDVSAMPEWLRAYFSHVRPLLMDRQTLLAHRALGVRE